MHIAIKNFYQVKGGSAASSHNTIPTRLLSDR